MSTSIAGGPPTDTHQIDGVRNDEIRGRAAGVVVCAIMGFGWAASALGAHSVVVTVPALTASAAVAAMLVVRARRLRRATLAVPESASLGAGLGDVRRRFNLIVMAEFIAIAAAISVLSRLGHSQSIPAAICAAVGLHFIPLARLFRVGLYYATAVALCLTAGVTLVLGAAGASPSAWRMLPGLGAALALWATGARLSRGDPRNRPPPGTAD